MMLCHGVEFEFEFDYEWMTEMNVIASRYRS